MKKDLANQTAVVTGSSSGIGRAIAVALANAGANVLVHARSNRAGAESTCELVRQAGSKADFVLADIGEDAGRDSLLKAACEFAPAIDIWVNNAGADVLTGEAASWSFARKLELLWQVDVAAMMFLSRAIGAEMASREAGAILNIGWDQADVGMAGDSGEMFAAIKGAVMAFTRSLAKSLAPHVRVNALAPGWIQTAWGGEASDYWSTRAVAESLRNRWGRPEDVAAAAAFLASPAADFITGQILPVNGGLRITASPDEATS